MRISLHLDKCALLLIVVVLVHVPRVNVGYVSLNSVHINVDIIKVCFKNAFKICYICFKKYVSLSMM